VARTGPPCAAAKLVEVGADTVDERPFDRTVRDGGFGSHRGPPISTCQRVDLGFGRGRVAAYSAAASGDIDKTAGLDARQSVNGRLRRRRRAASPERCDVSCAAAARAVLERGEGGVAARFVPVQRFSLGR